MSEKLEDGVDVHNKSDVYRPTPSPENTDTCQFLYQLCDYRHLQGRQYRPHPALQSDTSLYEKDLQIPGFLCGVVAEGYRP